MPKGFLIDMDGVIYSGDQLISGADTFIAELEKREVPFLFLTNNSQRTPRDMINKLAGLGIEAEEKHVFTSAMATGWYLARMKPHGSAYVLGEGGHNYSAISHPGTDRFPGVFPGGGPVVYPSRDVTNGWGRCGF